MEKQFTSPTVCASIFAPRMRSNINVSTKSFLAAICIGCSPF